MKPRDLLVSCLAWSGLVTLQLAQFAIVTVRVGLQMAENAIPVACVRLTAVTARFRKSQFDDFAESQESRSPPNGVRARIGAPENRTVAGLHRTGCELT